MNTKFNFSYGEQGKEFTLNDLTTGERYKVAFLTKDYCSVDHYFLILPNEKDKVHLNFLKEKFKYNSLDDLFDAICLEGIYSVLEKDDGDEELESFDERLVIYCYDDLSNTFHHYNDKNHKLTIK